MPRQQRPIEVAEQPVGPTGQEHRGGSVEIVVARVRHHLLGLHERVGGPAELQLRPGVNQPVGEWDHVAGQGACPLGVTHGLSRFAGVDRPPGQPAKSRDP